LITGLSVNSNYSGNISVTSSGVSDKKVSLKGSVTPDSTPTSITTEEGTKKQTIVSTEYYTITGQKIYYPENYQGVIILKNNMSDGSIQTSKVFMHK
jgi:hypothetical protein